MANNLFSNQSIEIKGKVIFDFSNITDIYIYCRRLLVDNNDLNEKLLELNLIDKETPVRIIIETI